MELEHQWYHGIRAAKAPGQMRAEPGLNASCLESAPTWPFPYCVVSSKSLSSQCCSFPPL